MGHKITIFLVIAVLASSAQAQDREKFRINCFCKTKANPSQCSVKIIDFEEDSWPESIFKNDNIKFTDETLSEFCYRKRDHGNCLCDDPKL